MMSSVKGGTIMPWAHRSNFKQVRPRSLNQLDSLLLLIGRHLAISLRGRQLTMPRQFHDDLDAHGLVCQRGNETATSA